MSSSLGNRVRISVFGQSHSAAIGCAVEGLPSGFALDMAALRAFMSRRAPGNNAWSTTRREADAVRIISGLNSHMQTCGAPLAMVIENSNIRSQDYTDIARIPRPGHADWVAYEKWKGYNDVPGGGHFSARLTAPLNAAGGICLQILQERGVRIAAHLLEVAGVRDAEFCAYNNGDEAQAKLAEQIDSLAGLDFPVLDAAAGEAMQQAIAQAHSEGDSVGGIIECVVTGLPVGIGEPMFDGMENLLARALFGIPAIKGVEFGRGFEAARMRGSAHNDAYEIDSAGQVRTKTNNAGGILGGITTGAPILFRIACKPTSSIAQEQDSVDLLEMEPAKLAVAGRHDPCIAPRAVPIAEAVAALTVLDAWESFPPQAV